MSFKHFLLSIVIFFYSASGVSAPNKAQFEIKKIKINNHLLTVEIADTAGKRELGLMNRTKLNKNSGMLFVFGFEKTVSFWMKNTFLNLDLAFFNKDKRLVDIASLNGIKSVMQKRIPQYRTKKKSLYVLEVNKGWFKEKKIKLGTAFEFVSLPGSSSSSRSGLHKTKAVLKNQPPKKKHD